MNEFLTLVNKIEIPDFWQFFLSFISAVLVVYLIEWLKQPNAEIQLLPDHILNDGRKLLKVKVKIFKKGWYRKLFPWQNAASFARLKGSIVAGDYKSEVVLFDFTTKWDTRPEPWDYEKNKPKLELLPATLEPENFVAGDEGSTSVAVKHPGDEHFYVYDGNYYVNQIVNRRDEKMIKLRLEFRSSSVSTTKDFMIINGNTTTEAFGLKEVI